MNTTVGFLIRPIISANIRKFYDSEKHQRRKSHHCSLRRLDSRPLVGGEKNEGRNENDGPNDFVPGDIAQGPVLISESFPAELE
jgi:hypothetical protein